MQISEVAQAWLDPEVQMMLLIVFVVVCFFGFFSPSWVGFMLRKFLSLWFRDGYRRCSLIIYQRQHQWEMYIVLQLTSLCWSECSASPWTSYSNSTRVNRLGRGWWQKHWQTARQTDRDKERWREKEAERHRERERQKKGKENFSECRMVSLINHLFFQFIPKVSCNTRSIVCIQHI